MANERMNWNEASKSIKIAELTAKIADAKDELSATDYKAIKNAEYAAVGLSLEYNPEDLYEERQALRDRINTWDTELRGLTQ